MVIRPIYVTRPSPLRFISANLTMNQIDIEKWPSEVHITDRDLKPDRHRDRDDVWADSRPSQVHITERDLKPIDIRMRAVNGLTSGPLKFISPKGT